MKMSSVPLSCRADKRPMTLGCMLAKEGDRLERLVKILNSKRGLIAALAVLVAAVVFAAEQYNAKEKYKAFVLNRAYNTDLPDFFISLNTADEIYTDILNTGTLSSRQRHMLASIHKDLADFVRNYRDLAVYLGRRDESFRNNLSSVNAMKIARYFDEWETEGTVVLDPSTRSRIEAMRDFDAAWRARDYTDYLKTVTYLNEDIWWIELLEEIEKSTNAFLAEREIDALDDLWSNRGKTQ